MSAYGIKYTHSRMNRTILAVLRGGGSYSVIRRFNGGGRGRIQFISSSSDTSPQNAMSVWDW